MFFARELSRSLFGPWHRSCVCITLSSEGRTQSEVSFSLSFFCVCCCCCCCCYCFHRRHSQRICVDAQGHLFVSDFRSPSLLSSVSPIWWIGTRRRFLPASVLCVCVYACAATSLFFLLLIPSHLPPPLTPIYVHVFAPFALTPVLPSAYWCVLPLLVLFSAFCSFS